MSQEPVALASVAPTERTASVDILRGIALCGILFMNIVAFGRYTAEYMNPAAAGPLEGANFAAWVFTSLFADMKFISIFSMLFGAGLVLLGDRITTKTGATGFAGIYYRRVLWLLLFGLLHAWLFWYGDILFAYAICGLIIYPMRNLSPRVLLIVGAAVVTVPIFIFGGLGGLMIMWYESGGVREALEAQTRGDVLSPSQLSTISQWNQSTEAWAPSTAILAGEKAAYTGTWLDALKERAGHNVFMQLFMLPLWALWRCGGLMLVGMAFMKMGVFSAARTNRFYGMCVVLGLAAGVPLTILAMWDSYQDGFTYARTLAISFNLSYIGSLGMAMAYLGIAMLLYRTKVLCETGVLGHSFAAMGRMAFTNYLMQTLICTTIFYGYGLGYFAAWERWQLVFIMVPIVLLLQLAYSPLWLRAFRMGPAEWLWRSLTYWHLQPMQRDVASIPKIG